MNYTLTQAREVVRRFVDSGSCRNAVIDARINEALDRLIQGEDWECLKKTVRINVWDRVFPLPWNCGKIMYACTDGNPARVLGQAYQFLSSGPGDLDFRTNGSWRKALADKGDNWPVMYDIPRESALNLCAFGTETGLGTIRVQGYDGNDFDVDEEVPVNQWAGPPDYTIPGVFGSGVVVSTGTFSHVTRVWKPTSTAPITLLAVDPATNEMHFLASYHPAQDVPGFRRYMITNADEETCTSVLAQVKLRHVPVTLDDDILPIPSLQALKLMVMAIRDENAGNLQSAVAYEAQARRLMEDFEKSTTMSDGTPMIMNHDYVTSLGRHVNHNILL
jgi:hypothetical protein